MSLTCNGNRGKRLRFSEVNRDKIFSLWWARALVLGVPFGVMTGLIARIEVMVPVLPTG